MASKACEHEFGTSNDPANEVEEPRCSKLVQVHRQGHREIEKVSDVEDEVPGPSGELGCRHTLEGGGDGRKEFHYAEMCCKGIAVALLEDC